ncbi:MAG TPA: helix-turn-helix domain-containing protein [Rubrobacter sp.]
MFYREGIRAVGVDAIAAEADVTKKTLYDKFGSKDKLSRLPARAGRAVAVVVGGRRGAAGRHS